MVTQQIKLYMDDTELPEIHMVSGDVGREIVLYVYPNKESTESLDLTTFELRVIYIKPDKTFVIQDYIDGIMDIPTQVGAVVGNGYYQIKLSKAGEEIYSAQGNLIIDDYILNDSMVESVAEVNGMKFPDDFLTSADLSDYVKQEEIADMATKTYVDNAISEIPSTLHEYSTIEKVVGKWIDGSTVYEKTFDLGSDIDINNSSWTNTGFSASGIARFVQMVTSGNTNGNCWGSGIFLAIINGNIYMQCPRINDTINLRYFTIRYTKTTATRSLSKSAKIEEVTK